MDVRASRPHETETVSCTAELLLTAEGGRELGHALRRALGRTSPGGLVIADLRLVQHAGYRALREVLIAVVVAHAELDYRYLVMWLQQENEELLATLEATATEQGIAVPLVLFPAGRPRTLGKLTKSERDTLELVERSGPVTAAELRSQVNLRTPSASNRLRRLYRLRLV